MKTSLFLTALLFLGLAACNNAGQNNNSSDSMQTEEADQTPVNASNSGKVPAVPADARVYFKNLKDGQTVSNPFKVEMGVDNMKVEPAGTVQEGSGHHHILIDAGDSMATGAVIPADTNHLHFGKGQTETELKLPKGKHKLTLQFADGLHRSYGSKLAKSIEITVK